MGPENEPGLASGRRTGDWSAFEALLDECRDRAYRLAYRLTGSHDDADEVLQDALVRAFHGMSGFRGEGRFSTWFWRILIRCAADHCRVRRRREAVVGVALSQTHQVADAGSDPSKKVSTEELREAVDEAILMLPVEQRTALVLVAFDRLSYADAAHVLQCPEGTLAWRIAEARKRLCQQLAPHLD